MVSSESWTNIAKIISKVLHPYVFFSAVVALVAHAENSAPTVWVRWTVIALLSAYLIPVFYARAKIAAVKRSTGSMVGTRGFFREQPNEMLLLACLFGAPSMVVLQLLGSPPGLVATVAGVAATSLAIALVNRVYRASFHLSLFTSMAVALVITFGLPAMVIAPFILVLGLSRYYLGEHTPRQLVVGFVIGLLVSESVFLLVASLSG